jgi:Tol biopolymer transport system component
MAAAAGLFVLGSLAFFGLQYRAFRKLGSVEPPAAGEGADAEPALRAEAAAGIRGLRGFVVWSSNRFGKHEIVKLTLPGMKLERLTDNAYVDTYPRLSPDGTKIVFCRSQLPWVSQRDHLPWDTYVLDLATGRERRVARDAYVPTWSEDGTRVFFERRACQVVEHELDTGRERVLFESGKAQVPEGVLLETPEFNGRAGELAVTYRRAQRATMVIGLDGSARRVGGGCQLSWSPDRSFLFFVDGGGRGKNAIWRFDPGTGGKALWLDLPGPYSHEYFPRLSRDGRWLVVGAAAEGHEHDRADYEIFLWPVGAPAESAARLTFHTGNDSWPDIWTE